MNLSKVTKAYSLLLFVTGMTIPNYSVIKVEKRQVFELGNLIRRDVQCKRVAKIFCNLAQIFEKLEIKLME